MPSSNKRKRTEEHRTTMRKREAARAKIQPYVSELHKTIAEDQNQEMDAEECVPCDAPNANSTPLCVVCAAPARYGRVNTNTGHFEKLRCKDCKIKGDTGKPPSWITRMCDFQKICLSNELQLLDTSKDWATGCKTKGKDYKPRIQCMKINCSCKKQIVSTTTINQVVRRGALGCVGRSPLPWNMRRNEFDRECVKINAICIDTPDEWNKGTESAGAYYKPRVKCTKPDCPCENQVVSTTCILSIIQRGALGCSGRSWIPWNKRRCEFDYLCSKIDSVCIDTLDEWEKGTRSEGAFYKPRLQCIRINCICDNEIVTTTSIHTLWNNKSFGCRGRWSGHPLNLWGKRRDEFDLICKDNSAVCLDTNEQWVSGTELYGPQYTPRIKCVSATCTCGGEIVTTTRINRLLKGSLGCSGRWIGHETNQWVNRRDEFNLICIAIGCFCLDTDEEWASGTRTKGHLYTPRIQCISADCVCGGEVVSSTPINTISSALSFGCSGRWKNHPDNLWRTNRSKFDEKCKQINVRCMDTTEEWEKGTLALGSYYKPKIRCEREGCSCDGEIVLTTTINNVSSHGHFGCGGRNKSENKACIWVEKNFPNAKFSRQARGPGLTHFDARLIFEGSKGTVVIYLEIDGPQHFNPKDYYYSDAGVDRDYIKERWAISRGEYVVRVLAKDVWRDMNNWKSFVQTSISKCLSDNEHRNIYHTESPEYTEAWSAYSTRRTKSI